MCDKVAATAIKTRKHNHPIPLLVKISLALPLMALVNAEAGESPGHANPDSKPILAVDRQMEIATIRYTHTSERISQPTDVRTVAIGAHHLDGKAARVDDSNNTLDLCIHVRSGLSVWPRNHP
jgi:hypothetical protein